jgi:hypothetical protein
MRRLPQRYESEEFPRDGVDIPGPDFGNDFRKSLVDPVGVRISSEPSMRSASFKRFPSSSDNLQGKMRRFPN